MKELIVYPSVTDCTIEVSQEIRNIKVEIYHFQNGTIQRSDEADLLGLKVSKVNEAFDLLAKCKDSVGEELCLEIETLLDYVADKNNIQKNPYL